MLFFDAILQKKSRLKPSTCESKETQFVIKTKTSSLWSNLQLKISWLKRNMSTTFLNCGFFFPLPHFSSPFFTLFAFFLPLCLLFFHSLFFFLFTSFDCFWLWLGNYKKRLHLATWASSGWCAKFEDQSMRRATYYPLLVFVWFYELRMPFIFLNS